MKALVLAERSETARALAAGARLMADDVVLVAIASLQVEEGTADKIVRIALPDGAVYDDAADTVISVFDAERPGLVLVEPTRRMKMIAGKLAVHTGTSVITDVMEFGVEGAK
ncbi:MAG: electron transfer flavoprotein subunit alpha/FixB family protein, partial [Raoultibacter sp.]